MKRVALALVLASSIAYAQQPDKTMRAKAAALYEKGAAHYEANRFSEAIPLFKEAYALVRDPVYLFNLAQSYRKVLDCIAASEHYERYLEEAKDADAKQKERVRGWLRELAPCVDERKREIETARAAQEAAAAAEAARREAEAQRLRAVGPQYKTIDNGKWFRIGGLVAIGAGAAGIGFGVRYSIKGNDIQSQLDDTCRAGCDWSDPAIRDKHDEGERANTLSTTFYVTGGLVLAGGVALYIIGRARVEHVEIQPTAGGATVSTRIAF